MPLFFLLSGFSCTLGYGRKNHQINNEENNTFDSRSFYFGRISRILPVYYFCYFYSLPLIPLGKKSSIRGLLLRCCSNSGFKSEDIGEFLHLQHKYSKSLSWAKNLNFPPKTYSNFLLRIVIWNIYVGEIKLFQYLLT